MHTCVLKHTCIHFVPHVHHHLLVNLVLNTTISLLFKNYKLYNTHVHTYIHTIIHVHVHMHSTYIMYYACVSNSIILFSCWLAKDIAKTQTQLFVVHRFTDNVRRYHTNIHTRHTSNFIRATTERNKSSRRPWTTQTKLLRYPQA